MNRIKQLRTEKRMRQTELAKILKIGQATMSNWETGRSEPDYDALIEMSEIFRNVHRLHPRKFRHKKSALT